MKEVSSWSHLGRCDPLVTPYFGGENVNYIVQYNELIQSGKIPASKRVKAIYKRLAKESQQKLINRKYVFDIEKAMRPIKFIEIICRHSKGEWAGENIRLELFQKAFIQALFGFVERKSGLRRYREAFFLCGRKNGKTTLIAGIALYMLTADKEIGAEVYTAATKYAQARLLFDEAHNMVKLFPDLSVLCRKRKNDLYYEPTMSKMQPLSRNSDSLDGLSEYASPHTIRRICSVPKKQPLCSISTFKTSNSFFCSFTSVSFTKTILRNSDKRTSPPIKTDNF